MNKTVQILQRVLRLIMLVVAIAMLAAAIFLTGVHMANKNLEKVAVTGQIVQGRDVQSIHEVKYSFQGQVHSRRPLDSYFRSLGQVGDKLQVYVSVKYPERVFVTRQGDGFMDTAGFMAGWGILLGVILLGEYQLSSRIKRLEDNISRQQSKKFDNSDEKE